MERKESSNGLQLIKFAGIRLKGNFSNLFMGAFAMCTPLILVLALPMLLGMLMGKMWIFTVGLMVFLLMIGPLQVGYIKFYNATLNGEQPRLKMVYSQFRFSVDTLKYVYFAGVLFMLYSVGLVLWIVPAGFAISFYSMVLFFQEKFKYNRFSDCFKDCARKMIGNRLAMFSYKLIFYLVYFMLFIVAIASLCLIYSLSLESLIISYIVTICTMIIFIFLYTMVTVYYHSCNHVFFEDTLMFNERRDIELLAEKEARAKKKNMKETALATAVEESDVFEPAPLVESPEVKEDSESKEQDGEGEKKATKPKNTTTKKSSTKTTTSKSNSTTKKTSTTKSTSKSGSTKKVTTTKKATAAKNTKAE